MVESSQLIRYISDVKWISFFFFLLPVGLFSDKVYLFSKVSKEAEEPVSAPWLTGPLLAPSALAVPMGFINIEPYLYYTGETGVYNRDWKVESHKTSYEVNAQSFFQFGIAPFVDFQITFSGSYGYIGSETSWALGDLPMGIGIQIWQESSNLKGWAPSVKIVFREIFPIGKYSNLSPKKGGTDGQGGGSYISQPSLVFAKLFHLKGDCFFFPRLLLQYSLPTSVRLKGFTVYGGGYGAKGRFFPPQNLEADLGVELSLTKNWALACDLVGIWAGRSRFRGNLGVDLDGQPVKLGTKSSVQYSLAPAIEYNWSASWGVIGGGWFTLGGRNAPRFWSGVFAINYYN